jgi:3-oxoacyl-[acyl-carrier-protein] synthase I
MTPTPSSTALPTRMPPMAVLATSVVTAAGVGRTALADALEHHRSALSPNQITSQPWTTMVGEVPGVALHHLPEALRGSDCRGHRLAHMGLLADGFAASLQRVLAHLGPMRVGLVMATTTASMGACEAAYRSVDAQGAVDRAWRNKPDLFTLHAPAALVAHVLGLQGPSQTVSTACSSANKALAVAQRWLALGWVDAVVVGGVDSLCDSVIFGFAALQVLSSSACQPFDAARSGINIGEAAGFALLVRSVDAQRLAPAVQLAVQAQVLGVGESSDAFHPTAPQPEGQSIEHATRAALAQAGLDPQAIDYVNLHGTATLQNDPVEAAMVARVYPASVHASSTKGCTGHTMGTSGMVETLVCVLAMERSFKPGTVNATRLDAACGPQIRLAPSRGGVRHAVNNAFGFGGTNAVVVLGAAP